MQPEYVGKYFAMNAPSHALAAHVLLRIHMMADPEAIHPSNKTIEPLNTPYRIQTNIT